MIRVFLDMDDTLAAFKTAFRKASGFYPDEFKAGALAYYQAAGIEKRDAEKRFVTDFWLVVLATKQFWENIPPMDDFKKTWKFFKKYNPVVLTAVPEFVELRMDAIRGKRKWIDKYMGEDIPMIHINLNSLKHDKMDKTIYCTGKDDFLIDDNKLNVESWNKAGGRAIYFSNAKDVIKQFKEMTKHDKQKKS